MEQPPGFEERGINVDMPFLFGGGKGLRTEVCYHSYQSYIFTEHVGGCSFFKYSNVVQWPTEHR
jgi:hypothetical protein